MAIMFACPACHKAYAVRDEMAGRRATCKSCATVFQVPGVQDAAHQPDNRRTRDAGAAEHGDLAIPKTVPGSALDRAVLTLERRGAGWVPAAGGLLCAAIVMTVILTRLYLKVASPYQPQPTRVAAPSPAASKAAPSYGAGSPAASDFGTPPSSISHPDARDAADVPVAIPNLPEVGPGHEVVSGVMLHEQTLPGGVQPGASGKLWLYLPTGTHRPRSLPCVMIAGAGSNLLSGACIDRESQPEHVPYVKAGFAVLAYELDGAILNENPSEAQLRTAAQRFLAAQAGLVNARVALAFLRTKVHEVDPGRIFVAGHSSAGTVALLVAENETGLRGCVAYAPAVDLEKRLGPALSAIRAIGCEDLVIRYSPKNGEGRLGCPVYVFHARDDQNFPAEESEAAAQRLRALGKAVTLELVPRGGHYMSMIHEGIPRAIAWLRHLAEMETTPVPARAVDGPPDRAQAETGQPRFDEEAPSIRSFDWVDSDSDYLGGHDAHDRPDGVRDQHMRVVLDLPPESLIEELTITSGSFHRWVTVPTERLWSVGVLQDGKVVTLEQVPTVGEFSGVTTLDLYVNTGIGIGRGTAFELEAVVKRRGKRFRLSSACRRHSR